MYNSKYFGTGNSKYLQSMDLNESSYAYKDKQRARTAGRNDRRRFSDYQSHYNHLDSGDEEDDEKVVK